MPIIFKDIVLSEIGKITGILILRKATKGAVVCVGRVLEHAALCLSIRRLPVLSLVHK